MLTAFDLPKSKNAAIALIMQSYNCSKETATTYAVHVLGYPDVG